jgi:hypothetical protein
MKKIVAGLCVFFVLASSGCSRKSHQDPPFNRIVIILDASGTFRKRVGEALPKIQGLVAGIEGERTTRYDAQDEILIISLNGHPSVIWAGYKDQLDQLTEQQLQDAFGVTPKPDCTDVGYALNLAGFKLNAAPPPTAKYLFAFTDLLNEPVTKDGKSCLPLSRPSLPPRSVEWDSLADASMTFFWVSDVEIRGWEQVLAPKHLNLKMLDEAASRNANIESVPKAKRKISAQEQQQAQEGFRRLGVVVAIVAGAVIGLVVLMGVALSLIARRRRRAVLQRRTIPPPQTVRG